MVGRLLWRSLLLLLANGTFMPQVMRPPSSRSCHAVCTAVGRGCAAAAACQDDAAATTSSEKAAIGHEEGAGQSLRPPECVAVAWDAPARRWRVMRRVGLL